MLCDEFVKCKQVPEGKGRGLREKGLGKRPKHLTSKMKSSYGKIVYFSVEQTSKSVLYTLFYLLTFHSSLRGCKERNNMFLEDFILNKDDQGTEYVALKKTKQRSSKAI